jgi:hypothetical protein
MTWADHLIERITRRPPDFVIGGTERPYLRRWFVIPRNPIFNIYLHQFLRSDDDRALHDHPWLFNASFLLRGDYIEWVPGNGNAQRPEPRFLHQGAFKFRWGGAPHRLQLHSFGGIEATTWTLFITGPRVRQWGFYCPQGWMHWKRFTATDDPGAVGKGCDA